MTFIRLIYFTVLTSYIFDNTVIRLRELKAPEFSWNKLPWERYTRFSRFGKSCTLTSFSYHRKTTLNYWTNYSKPTELLLQWGKYTVHFVGSSKNEQKLQPICSADFSCISLIEKTLIYPSRNSPEPEEPKFSLWNRTPTLHQMNFKGSTEVDILFSLLFIFRTVNYLPSTQRHNLHC